jgi:ABC-type branched-subunit amino acid transport system permease subunit
MQFYLTTLLVIFGVNIIAIWGLDMQFGTTGIFNFAYIVFQSAGAYTAGILSLGPDTANGGFQKYVGGAQLPFPLPLLGAAAVGGILSIPLGLLALRRLRGDYQAMVMLVISVIATGVANAQLNLVNGPAGLSLIPQPLSNDLPLTGVSYQWFYVGLTALVCLVAFWISRGITGSPFGRVLRAVRDSETAAAALGRSVTRAQLTVFVIGGALGGLSGGLLVEFLGSWGPASWLYPETFLFFTAIIVGGMGNLLGNVLGALLVPVGFVELTRFLPAIGYPGLIDSLDWVAIGLLLLAFLWLRPKGILPERRRVFPGSPAGRRGENPVLAGGGQVSPENPRAGR